jgi:hypothetical protein
MPPVKPTPKSADDSAGWMWGGGIVLLIVFLVGVGKCSSDTVSTNIADSAASNMADANISAAISAQGPPAVEPLSEAGVKQGLAQLRLAEKAESLSGAMIYSQNCYDALSHQFSWTKLDSCGAADMLAVRTLPEIDTAPLDAELKYFGSEAAAGRYLAAATGAGQPADEADKRLSQLQARVAHAALPVKKPAAPANDLLGNSSGRDIVIPYNASGE